MARTYRLVVGAVEAGMRLDQYLTRRLPQGASRAMVQRRIRDGLVAVDGRPARAHAKLRRGAIITARFDELPASARPLPLIAQPIALEIVYEDEHLLAVNKPAGLVTHPAPGHWDGTLVNAVLWHLQQTAAAQAPVERAGIVHRLDKDTSGLLLVAKTEAMRLSLSRQLAARAIHRRYLAVVEGHLPQDAGTINAPLGRHATHRKEMTVRHLGGRAAVTRYRVLRRAGSSLVPAATRPASAVAPAADALDATALAHTVLEVLPETGRTHQLRVHLAHLGHPVVGDPTYGRHPARCWREWGVARHLLHAWQVTFPHPATGRTLTLSAPIPEDLAPWLEGLTWLSYTSS
jgi:23S rRNA pseudouridine1911/1915/1917 synthase